jgi:hypothetical protein
VERLDVERAGGANVAALAVARLALPVGQGATGASSPVDEQASGGVLNTREGSEAVARLGGGGHHVLQQAWQVEVAVEAAHELCARHTKALQAGTQRGYEPSDGHSGGVPSDEGSWRDRGGGIKREAIRRHAADAANRSVGCRRTG